MALPVTYHGSNIVKYWTNTGYKRVTAYSQAKPVDRPLPYRAETSTLMTKGGTQPYSLEYIAINGSLGSVKPSTWNTCYARLRDAVSNRASLGVSLAEAGQSTSMIRDRLLQVYQGFRAIRKGNFAKAAKVFTLNDVPKGVTRRKHWSSNVLEYQLGWRPLIGDIYSAVDSLQNPYKDVQVKARAVDWIGTFYHYPKTTSSNPNAACGYVSFSLTYARRTVKNVVAMGAQVKVENPNLWLANQLGLVNPAVVALELVPFSFVAGWFINLEQVLSSMTDWLGLSMQNTWNSQRQSGIFEFLDDKIIVGCASCGDGCTYRYPIPQRNWTEARYTHLVRGTGLIYPVLHVPAFQIPHLSRCVTAAALVTSLLSGGPTRR